MISIYFRESDTLLARAKMLKNNRLKMLDVRTSTSSFYNAIFRSDASQLEKESLQAFFAGIRQNFGNGSDGIFIILPDYAFKTVECVETASNEEFIQRIEILTGLKIEELYWKVPLTCVPSPTQKRRTVFAIERSVIQNIVDLAGDAGLKISSVEPASLAFLRAYGVFQEERIFMEITETQGLLVSYSPIGGFFKMEAPSLPINQLAKANDPDSVFANALQIHDAMADKTFSACNTNIPVIIQSEAGGGIVEHSAFLKDRNKKAVELFRAYTEPVMFANYIESEISPEAQVDWMANAGTFLQDIPSEALLEMVNCPANLRITIESGNLLPEDVVINSKFWHWQLGMFKILRAAVLFLVVGVILEITAYFFFSSVSVPESLQQEYETAKKESDNLEAEFKLIKQAEQENQYPVEAFQEIMKYKPAACRFLEARFGSQSQVNDAKWITLRAVAKEPVALQDFIAALSNSEMFKHVSLTKLDDQSSVGYKSADYTIAKGKIK